MLLDARNLPRNCKVEADVCIVGSGPAGVTLATSFLATGHRVVVLAGGGREFDPRTQELYRAPTSGDPYLPPVENRRRQFGGTSNAWCIQLGNGEIGVRYVPFDDIDFKPRAWVPNSGWPITREELVPYYERAHRQCEIGPFLYDVEDWSDDEHRPLPFSAENLQTSVFHFGPSRVYYDAEGNGLASSDNVEVFLHGHAVDLVSTEGREAIRRVDGKTLEQNRFSIEARHVVVASGGIDSARILMASDGGRGVGYTGAALGRYYMDHMLLPIAWVALEDPRVLTTLGLYDLRRVKDCPTMGKLVVPPEAQEREGMLNACVSLLPRPSRSKLDGLVNFVTGLESIAAGERASGAEKLLKALPAIDQVGLGAYHRLKHNIPFVQGFAKGGWSQLAHPDRRYEAVELFAFMEQVPDPANRVRLLDVKDELGVPQVEVEWRWNELDIKSVDRLQHLLKTEMTKAGIGSVSGSEAKEFTGIETGMAHHLGATRMHENPELGVVDRNCKVHGVDNLYIASSAVFPTGSYANPTLTIVALAHRLADHLKDRL